MALETSHEPTAPAILDESASKPHTRGCLHRFSQVVEWLAADLYRYEGQVGWKPFLKHFLFTPGYKYTVWMRLCGYFRVKPWARMLLIYHFFKWMLLRVRYKYGIAIPEYCVIGPGFHINRFGGIYVNGDSVIGANVNINHGVLLGQANRGPNVGAPVLGDRVFLGSGAKIIGRLNLGDDSCVGANAVVTKDVPPKGVVGGVPAKLLSLAGSAGYFNRQASVKDPRIKRT